MSDDQREQRTTIPAFASGGRVKETGIALVHEGETIVPAPGSAAQITAADPQGAGEGVVNLYFPVEIEVVGRFDEGDRNAIQDGVFARLCDAFERLV